MAKMALTDLSVRGLKPTGRQHAYWCTLVPNFGLMLSQAGGKSFFVMLGRERRRVHLGKYPATSLKDARDAARRLLLAPNSAAQPLTFAHAFQSYLEAHVRPNYRPRTAREVERLFSTHLPQLHDRRLAAITTADLSALFSDLVETPALANNLYGVLRTFFRWSVARDTIQKTPLTFPKPYRDIERDRVLTDTELVSVYQAVEDLAYSGTFSPFGFIILFCIHTGMRRSEVASLMWSYITPELITLPGEITKNGNPHVFPNFLNPFLQLIPKKSEYLFASDTGKLFSAWSEKKRELDRFSGVSDWVIHDLRRTFATKMAEWQLAQPHVIERMLNHTGGSMSPIARVYNRATYLAEMRTALIAYEKKLAELLGRTWSPTGHVLR
jgi:integrase